MKNSILLSSFILMTLGILVGCAGNKELIKEMSTSATQNVFQEERESVPAAKGYADLQISFSMKTHVPGLYSGNDKHGTPDVELLLNIDGQAISLRGNLQKENRDLKGQTSPESGDGIRYSFSTKLRLKAGTHKIFAAIPDDGIALTREISLEEGEMNNLVLEPLYNHEKKLSRNSADRRPGIGISNTSFKEGLGGIRFILNGRKI